MTSPLVSVVIPTYNRAHLLGDTLESVLAQTYPRFEVIVVDDGSTDETLELLQHYRGAIRVISQENQGEGPARNTGIGAARGEYLAFVDSDDLWLPEKLQKQMQVLVSKPELRWAYSDAYVFDGSTGEVLHNIGSTVRQREGFVARYLVTDDFIPSPTPVIHRSIFSELGGFSALKIGADWEMWLRIAAKYPVGRLDEALAGYRVHPNMVSRREDELSLLRSRIRVIERAIELAPHVYGRHRKRAISHQYVLAGREFMLKGESKSARGMYEQAIRTLPWSFWSYLCWASTLPHAEVYLNVRRVYLTIKRRIIERRL